MKHNKNSSNLINGKYKKSDIDAYLVRFGRNEGEDNYENYTSYSTQIDRISGATSSYSSAIFAASKYFGRVYIRLFDGSIEEFQRDLKSL